MNLRDPVEAAYFAAVAICAAIFTLRFGISWLRHNRKRDELDREPRCATCGYIVAKCTSTICPECGRDIREHGIITSKAHPRVGIAPLCILLVLIALPMTMSAGVFLARWQPFFGWRYHYEQFVAISRDGGATYGPPRYSVQSSGSGRFFSRHPDYVWVYCNSDGTGQSMLVVDLQTQQCAVVDASGRKSAAQPIGAALMREFLRLQSPDASDEQLKVPSERIVSAIRTAMTGDIPTDRQILVDLWNGTSRSYLVADSVILAMWLLSWMLSSFVLFVAVSRLRKLGLRNRRQLWHAEVERLGLGRAAEVGVT